MTNEQAIKVLNMVEAHGSLVIQAKEMAIKALEQEPCGKDINVPATDAISREAVEDAIIWNDEKREMLDEIQKLPSVQAKQKTGTWKKDIDNSRRWDRVRFYCSECGSWQTYGETDYCPSCGARMIKPQESEGKNDN